MGAGRLVDARAAAAAVEDHSDGAPSHCCPEAAAQRACPLRRGVTDSPGAFLPCVPGQTTQEYTKFRDDAKNDKGERIWDHMTSADRMKFFQELLGPEALIMLLIFWR